MHHRRQKTLANLVDDSFLKKKKKELEEKIGDNGLTLLGSPDVETSAVHRTKQVAGRNSAFNFSFLIFWLSFISYHHITAGCNKR